MTLREEQKGKLRATVYYSKDLKYSQEKSNHLSSWISEMF
jgi:hypothetical protein